MIDRVGLNVVHIISGLGQGGAETVLFRLVTAPGQAHRHTVISLSDEGVFGPRLREAGVRVMTQGMPPGRLTLKGLAGLYRTLRALQPDVVQTWMYHADLVGGIVARLAGIKAVSWGIRNSGAHLERSSRVTRFIARVCATISGLVPATIVSCAHEAARRHQQWGYSADRMVVIPNGYDFSRWQSDAALRLRWRAQWGVALDEPLLGAVARWNPLKDHANLLAAVALCRKQFPRLKLALIGEGMTPDNPALVQLIGQHGLADCVLLLGRRDDVPAIMNALDIHVLSSCAEGFPNVVAEAMATGVANVVTRVGDAAQIVGEEGWVAPPQDSTALSEALGQALQALGTPAMAGRLQRGRERVMRDFGLDTMVNAYDAVWRRLAARLRVLVAVNNPAFLLSHRLPVILAARDAGFNVHIATMDGPDVPKLRAMGFTHHVLPMNRSGRNPFTELLTLLAFWRLFHRVKPALVHSVTIKPVLYGGIAARLAGVPAYVAAISGLGFVFLAKGWKQRLVRRAALVLYRFALGHPNSRVIVQNTDDQCVLTEVGAVRPGQAVMIRGSGVSLTEFPAQPEPSGPPVAIMVSRLLYDKGVTEFVEAARYSVGHGSGLRWVLVGAPDPGNPASVSASQLEQWKAEKIVECLGERTDIAQLYAQAHIAVLPSYREGLPKSLIEAAACGRAVVTTDVPGCRDAIEPDVTGLLVPVRDACALAEAVQRLAGDAALRQRMGQAGRHLAEKAFDVRQVQRKHIEIYTRLCLGGSDRKSAPEHTLSDDDR